MMHKVRLQRGCLSITMCFTYLLLTLHNVFGICSVFLFARHGCHFPCRAADTFHSCQQVGCLSLPLLQQICWLQHLKVAAHAINAQSSLQDVILSVMLWFIQHTAWQHIIFPCCQTTHHVFHSQCGPSPFMTSFPLDLFLVDGSLNNRKSCIYSLAYNVVK